MRLIDADKLGIDILDLPNCHNGFSDTYDKAMILDLIDEQPTVDAVPFSLIDRMIDEYQNAVAEAVFAGEFYRADRLSEALVALKLAKANALKEMVGEKHETD